MTRKKVYRVEGLDCAEEVVTLTRALRDRPGVIDLGFDVLNARMTVTYNDEQISPDAIVAAVAETGMSAVPWGERALEAEIDGDSGRDDVLHGHASLQISEALRVAGSNRQLERLGRSNDMLLEVTLFPTRLRNVGLCMRLRNRGKRERDG